MFHKARDTYRYPLRIGNIPCKYWQEEKTSTNTYSDLPLFDKRISKIVRTLWLTVLSEVNQVTIMWVPGHSGIQQNETADRVARTRPIGPEPFLPLSFSRFKSEIRNWIEKR